MLSLYLWKREYCDETYSAVTCLPFILWHTLSLQNTQACLCVLWRVHYHHLCCHPSYGRNNKWHMFCIGGETNTVPLSALCPTWQEPVKKKKLPLQDCTALYPELAIVLAWDVLRREPGKIETDSCRMNMNIKIRARRPLLQMEYRDMPLTFCCWTCLPSGIGKLQWQRSAALLS